MSPTLLEINEWKKSPTLLNTIVTELIIFPLNVSVQYLAAKF